MAAALKLIFAQPDRELAGEYLRQVAMAMQARWPRAAEMLLEAEDDILVYKTFPEKHHRSIRSTNPLERLIREVHRRTRVVGVFPNRPSVLRLAGTLLIEQDEEWRAGKRYFSQESIRELLDPDPATKAASLLVEPLINLEAQAR